MLSRSIPVYAILVETVFGYAAIVRNYASPRTVFSLLLNSSGAVALSVYRPIAVSELGMRRRLEREAPEELGVKRWLYPWLTFHTIALTVCGANIHGLHGGHRRATLPDPRGPRRDPGAYALKTLLARRDSSRPVEE